MKNLINIKYYVFAFMLLNFAKNMQANSSKKEKVSKIDELINEINNDLNHSFLSTSIKSLSASVVSSLKKTKREKFVPKDLQKNAYENRPLAIGYGQTISQPFIVALMTEILNLKKSDKVLEIGTGSGYQAAILSHIVKSVYSIEIIPQLAKEARSRLKKEGYSNVTVLEQDGYFGIKSESPFDAIIVTAAASHIPPKLIEQLSKNGRMIIPVGSPFQTQYLIYIEKKNSKIISKNILPVRFVPFTGEISTKNKKK